ncbi:hypothetical protein ES703_27382 [subsurface metagenome]
MLIEQMKIWEGIFGKEYTDRNLQSFQEMENLHRKFFGMSRTEMNSQFLGALDRSLKILEIGCNIGDQLLCLQKMGFNNLSGVELQSYAAAIARTRLNNIEIFCGSVFDLPVKTESFDFIFTSNVLIHIKPIDIKNALAEIYRCTRRYIWGLEYFAREYQEIKYRDRRNLLWKTDFVKLWQMHFPSLKLVKEKHFKYLENENIDTMFLLEKNENTLS